MKILLVSNGFPPRQWAGTETYTAGIAQELHRRGHEVQVLCGGDWTVGTTYWGGAVDESYHDIPVCRLNVNWMKAPDPFGYLYNNPEVAGFLKGYLQKLRPDLVHITSCERLSASVIRVAKDANLPVVLSLTDFWFLCPRITLLRSDGENCNGQTSAWDCTRCLAKNAKIYRWSRLMMSEEGASHFIHALSRYPVLTRQRGLRGMIGDMEQRKRILYELFTLVDCRITASRFVRDTFVENGFAAPIKLQPYGHDIAWLDNYRGKSPAKRLRIGFIGQIIETKGVHLLLQAIAHLQETYGEQIEIRIYGNLKKSVEYSAYLLSLAAGMENVHFCGTYAHEESGAVFSEIDVLVVPSVWYDFPLIMHEAFAANTPVIATNLAGMAETVKHNVNGLLFERGDVSGLTTQLQRLFDEPELLGQLRAGIKPVKTIREEVNELEAVYRQVTVRQVAPSGRLRSAYLTLLSFAESITESVNALIGFHLLFA
jgi:glycosyltransferase involved in cell wall biosynthesis